MTTVVFYKGFMGADTCVTTTQVASSGHEIKSYGVAPTKIVYQEGKIYGYAGDLQGIYEFLLWKNTYKESMDISLDISVLEWDGKELNIYETEEKIHWPDLITASILFPLVVILYLTAVLYRTIEEITQTKKSFKESFLKFFQPRKAYKRIAYRSVYEKTTLNPNIFYAIGSGGTYAEAYFDKLDNNRDAKEIVINSIKCASKLDTKTNEDIQVRNIEDFKNLRYDKHAIVHFND